MPAVSDIPGPYRFFFYSLDCREPPHVHVSRDRSTAKFWLDEIRVARSAGFERHELNRIRRHIFEYRDRIMEGWREHCGNGQAE